MIYRGSKPPRWVIHSSKCSFLLLWNYELKFWKFRQLPQLQGDGFLQLEPQCSNKKGIWVLMRPGEHISGFRKPRECREHLQFSLERCQHFVIFRNFNGISKLSQLQGDGFLQLEHQLSNKNGIQVLWDQENTFPVSENQESVGNSFIFHLKGLSLNLVYLRQLVFCISILVLAYIL